MTREQAINSMISHGFTVEQAGEIIKAVTPQLSSELDKNSKKLEKGTAKNDLGVDCVPRQAVIDLIQNSNADLQYYFENEEVCNDIRALPSVTPQLSVPEVTALAEWTTKLTKASEEAYNKGYADGMKAQEPRKGKWLAIRTKDGKHEMTCSCCGYVRVELINRSFTEETALEHLKDRIDENKFCPNCGADMREVEE